MSAVITPGALLVKSMLPEGAKASYDPTRILDKGGVSSLMSNIITNGGGEAHNSIQNLSRLFFNTATEQGFSTPLSDYENDSDERKALIQEFKKKIMEVTSNPKLSVAERNDRINLIAGEYQDKAQSMNLRYMVGKGSTAGRMALTGARGNPMQLGQGTFSPLMVEDIEGNPIPLPIERSFAEGLTPAEHMAVAYGGRAATVKTQLSTSEPGALFKRLTPTVFHEVVTMPDCGTENGVVYPVADRHRVINHVEAGTNTPITDSYYRDLVKSGQKTVKVRTSTTCEAPKGVCQRCYGYDSRGFWPEIGENVGTVAAQSVSEVLTQAMLGTKHKGGAAGKKRDTFAEASNMLKMPENFKDEATLASLPGVVHSVNTTALGDSSVVINGVSHFVPVSQKVLVKPGDEVYAGQAVSTGTVNPKDLVAYRGMGEGRRYMSATLRDIYGGGLDPRHFDLIAKNLIRYAEVTNPGETDLMPGDVMDVARLEPYLQSSEKEVSIGEATGKVTSRRILEVLPGTHLDQTHVKALKEAGVKSVHVTESGLKFRPKVVGIESAKLLDPNWVSRLSSSNLKSSIMEAAARGQSSDIHSTDPITPYVFGTEFGEGSEGRY